MSIKELLDLLQTLDLTKQEKSMIAKHTFSYKDLASVKRSPLSYWISLRKEDLISDTEKRNRIISSITKQAMIDPFSLLSEIAIMPDFGDLRYKEPKAKKLAWLESNQDKFGVTELEYEKIKNISKINQCLPDNLKFDKHIFEDILKINKVDVVVPEFLLNDKNIINISMWSDYSRNALDIENALDKYGLYFKSAIQILSLLKKESFGKSYFAYVLIINKSDESDYSIVKLNQTKLDNTVEEITDLCKKLVEVIETNDRSLAKPKIYEV